MTVGAALLAGGGPQREAGLLAGAIAAFALSIVLIAWEFVGLRRRDG